MSWGKIYCDTNWGENKYRTAGSIINEATPDCFQFPEFVTFKDHVRSEGATYEKMQCGIDILLFLGRSISITPQSPDNPTFSGILDTYTGATAGYSTRRLTNTYTGGLIRVRRSSDDTEQDIGYDANGEDMDTFGLLAFVNAEHTIADEDFSSAIGWTLAAGVAISGGVLRCLNSSASSTAYKNFGASDGVGTKIRVSFTISNYSGSGTISFKKYGTPTFTETSSDQGTARSGNGTFTEELTFSTITTNQNWGFFTSGNFTGDIDNFEVVQITADGHVTTWYDQTGNNDLTNGSASEQPLIVEAGSIVTKGGETAIKFQSLEYLQKETASTSWVDETNVSIFSVFSCVDFAHTSEADKDCVYNISGDEISGGNGNSIGAMTRNDQLRIGFYDQGAGSYGQKKGLQSPPNDTQILVSSIYDSTTTLTTTLNASTTGSVVSNPELSLTANTYTLGALHNGAKLLDGTIQEHIVWNADETTDRNNIANAINTYFDIYTP